ncbi:oxidoreductase [Phytohabitans rumicis]|uniref:Short-chain dehydrogenase/reductase n=1 Tax=Phytohabitans rumicis TaxID=1076125 RepID=A0A6V8LMI6_9ACTN|nr:oxidoreductase [Phytohabitans rumicis]GFJ96078.1 short-chain dehydrogenase/reductase [Phytohabitans rumicis]
MTDKVAIVTGASSGIGEATARKLRTQGFTVYAAARRVDRMAPLAEVGIRPVRVDVTDDASMVGFVEQVVAESGRVDVLVNNAGYGSYGAVEDVPLDEARRQFEVNVFGLARLTQLVLPHMRRQGSGRIVNISSIGGKIYEPLGGWYHATKFAVEGLSDSMRMELAPLGIHVVVIQPGAIATEWSGIAGQHLLATSGQGAYADQAERAAAFFMADPTGQASPPSVIANAVAKAATARRPRTRYAVGRGAKPILAARRVLPDRAFDRLMDAVLRNLSRVATRQAARERRLADQRG